MRGEFQVIVTTDAGNEGIDLQAAHVLVNYDIPWSLVRLEQRMGRIHRVGQTRDVFLYNLVATDTREGETLLDAARQLRHRRERAARPDVRQPLGRRRDHRRRLRQVAVRPLRQRRGRRSSRDRRRHSRCSADDLKRVARQVKDTERRLASQVDAVAALTLLQRDLFARINPAIVEAYLDRLDAAGIAARPPTAAGDGFRQLAVPAASSRERSAAATSVHVATSGDAVRGGRDSIDLGGLVTLGPGEPAFTDLIDIADHELAEDVLPVRRRRGPDEPHRLRPVRLPGEHDRERTASARSIWATLVKVDDGGNARPVRWETLANLVPSDQSGTLAAPCSAAGG